MKCTPTRIPDVLVIESPVFRDPRGEFMEFWHRGKLSALGLEVCFVQDNWSRSVRGTLRGLHYQFRQPQGKLVRVLRGKVFDVAVDLRRSSPTFGQWIGEELSAGNRRALWVPPGFAHGFYVLSAMAEVFYKCTDFYAPDCERTLAWDDPALNIAYPLLPNRAVLLSPKDATGSRLKDADLFP